MAAHTKKLLHLILMGATASGKGTISKLITDTFDNFVHVSLGHLLRVQIDLKTPLGQKVSSYVKNGVLVPDQLVVESVFEELNKVPESNWILDGFPRTLMQAQILHGFENDECEKYTSKAKELKKFKVTAVFNLSIPDDVIIERARKRWIHLPSGRIYSEGFHEPRVKWKDDETGENLVKRADDNPTVVAERLKLHREFTCPVLQFYCDHQVEILELETEKIENAWHFTEQYLREKLQK